MHFNSPRDWFETCGIKKHYSEGANLLGRAENYFCYLHIYLFIFLIFFQETEVNGTTDARCYDYGWASFGTLIQSPYLKVRWKLLLDKDLVMSVQGSVENFL